MRTTHRLVHDFFAAVTAGELPDDLLTPDMKAWLTTQGNLDKAAYQHAIRLLAKLCARPLTFSIDSITTEEDRTVAEVHSEGTLIKGKNTRTPMCSYSGPAKAGLPRSRSILTR